MSTPLSLANLTTPPTAADWFATLIGLQNTLGLPTTSWQPGSIERALDTSYALASQQSDVAASIMIMGGFLDLAASYITYVDANGVTQTVYVTPDPSIPAQNPTGALGWLDLLSDSVYDVQRILQTQAGGTEAIVNTSASTYGPFVAGTYHVAQPTAPGSPGYTNTSSLTIPPTAQLGGGPLSSIGNSGSLILITTAAAHGLNTGDLAMVIGAGGIPQLLAPYAVWTITKVNGTQFTLNGSTFSGGWTGTGSAYAPQTAAFIADNAGTGSNAATANVVTQPVTSLIGVSVNNTGPWIGSDTEGNASLVSRCRLKLQSISPNGPLGAYQFFALSSQTYAPLLNPAQQVGGVITRARVDVTATGTVFVTIANASGAPSSPDVTATDAVIQAYAVPVSVTETTQAAADHAITATIKVYLPSAYKTAVNDALFIAAINSYFQALPIGGVTLPGGTSPNTNVVPYDGVIGSVFAAAAIAGIPLATGDVEGTLDGGSGPVMANIQLLLSPVPEVAVPTVVFSSVGV